MVVGAIEGERGKSEAVVVGWVGGDGRAEVGGVYRGGGDGDGEGGDFVNKIYIYFSYFHYF